MEPVICTGFYTKREDSLDDPLPPPPRKAEYLPLAYTTLTPYLKEKAERELNESEENIRNGLAKLKELIAAEPISCLTDDDFLMLFLRAKKYDVNRSFQQLKNYWHEGYRLRDIISSDKMFSYSNYPNPKLCGVLPKRDEEGRAVIYFSANEFSADDEKDIVICLMMILCFFTLTFPATQVSGICFIADATISSVESLQLLFRFIKDLSPKVDMFPARFKRFDIINVNAFFQAAFNLFKNFLPSKMLQRVTLHGDPKESLLNIYPPEILPEEFGGSMGTLVDIQPTVLGDLRKALPKLLDTKKFQYPNEI